MFAVLTLRHITASPRKIGDIVKAALVLPLGTWELQGNLVPITSVGQAIRGTSTNWPNIVELIKREKMIKDACYSLKVLLEMASTFGHEHVFDIDASLVED
ncbi:MAG: hypothetical protein ABW224_00085 [Kibdelosporangium sp.]